MFYGCQQYENVQHCHENGRMGHLVLFYFMLLYVLHNVIVSLCYCVSCLCYCVNCLCYCVSCPATKWQLL
jgi:hypothetical protein